MKQAIRILYLSHYFPPEVNAPAVRVSLFSKLWSSLGHKVTVITGFPNHPTGVIPPEYRGKWFQTEQYGSIRLLRSFVYAAPNRGFVKRVINYLSFMVSATISAIVSAGKQDLVIATSPQFFVAVAGFVISRLKRIPFVFEVRDIWPEEIVAVGAMKRGLIFKMLEKLELFLYHRAAAIIAVAQGTVDILTCRGVPAEKIFLIPNGVELDEFTDVDDDHTVRDQYNLNGHYLVSYIGTHGMAHNLQTVLKAADRLKNQERVKFLMVGDGAEKENLLKLKSHLRLDNVTFAPQQDRLSIPRYYAASDVCLVPLRRAELFTKNIPSKIYEIMASSKPILIGTEGESKKLVEQANAGLSFEPDNDADLAEKILELYNDRQLSTRLGINGKRFAGRHYSQADLSEKYLTVLKKLVN